MKNKLKQIIVDFHDTPLPTLFNRPFSLIKTNETLRKAHVLIGMRRSGKTYVMYQLMETILQKKIPKTHILYINFEDDRLIGFNHTDFQNLLDAYLELYPEISNSKDIYFFFDEIQEIKGWEKFIRRLLDKEAMHIIITGSSSKMLSKEIATTLRGRTFTYEIFPFSLNEVLNHHKLSLKKVMPAKQMALITKLTEKYLSAGGFPETLDQSESISRMLLQNYIDTVIFKDIIERHNISNARLVKLLLVSCIQNAASIFSIQKTYQRYKSNGEKISKNSLYEFMQHYQDAYCILQIPIYNHSIHKRTVNPQKIYPIDPGLITAYSVKKEFDKGIQFETTIFLHLRRYFPDIFYYKTASGKEVDFLVLSENGEIQLYQACLSMENDVTIKREETALLEAMEETGVKNGIILILELSEEKIKKISGKTIHWQPFIHWLISKS